MPVSQQTSKPEKNHRHLRIISCVDFIIIWRKCQRPPAESQKKPPAVDTAAG
jgi:hypothetical protein